MQGKIALPDLRLTGNFNYEKKIETRAMNDMLFQTRQMFEDLLEKRKNSTTDGTIDELIEELMEICDKF